MQAIVFLPATALVRLRVVFAFRTVSECSYFEPKGSRLKGVILNGTNLSIPNRLSDDVQIIQLMSANHLRK